ncbi:hypothetical protein PPSIR1_13845 [Plesiocystis pacifica SIR-1]|uniref:Uncharacterized protein n=1 Tax=Plesiocystis pacifica SIR-1 TaxID=391625 RepID=A6G8V4_9BACT|nr:hypothetical protein [Plesiocystis pacifica]EDM77640.1 hypothetical protein PPSIR1_13845 [Plesiocystis pacifica SIR-1]
MANPTTTLLSLTGALLRAPEQLLVQDNATPRRESERLALLAPRLLALVGLGAGAFGMVLGSYRGELQYVYAAVKAPALLLVPVLVGLPAIRSFYAACELRVSWSRLALAALLATARTAVLAAALAPVLWLYLSMGPNYHSAILAMVACLGAVGLPGLWTLTRALPEGGRNRGLATLTSVAVLAVLLAQTGWLLRPFIARPQAEVTFLRAVEADVFSSLASTQRSVKGDYRGWEVEAGGVLGRRQKAQREQPIPTGLRGADMDIDIDSDIDSESPASYGLDYDHDPSLEPKELPQ